MLFIAKEIKISFRFSTELSAGKGLRQQASRGDGAGERLKDPQTDISCSPGAGLSAGVGEFGAPFVPTNVKSGEKEQSSGVGGTYRAPGLS